MYFVLVVSSDLAALINADNGLYCGYVAIDLLSNFAFVIVVNNNKIAARKSPVSSNRPISSHQVPKKKVVYEKLNYNAYIANKKKAPAKKVVGYKPKIGNKK